MTKANCLAMQRAVFEAGEASRVLEQYPELAAHLGGCADCHRWIQRFTEGVADAGRATDLGSAVTLRTEAAACLRARDLAGGSFDEPLRELDRTLLAQHLDACDDCRVLVTEMAGTRAVLPALADIDPGPAFTARVLAATSRRQAGARFVDRWQRIWTALVGRPRFALEAAYALTVVFVLAAGNPMAAFERTASRVEPVARQRVAGRVEDVTRAIAAGLDALKERTIGRAALPAAESGLLARVRALWDRAIGVLAGGLSDLLTTIESAAERLWSWGRDLFGLQPTTGEPTAAPVRSSR